jgi:hypothetical protein
MWPDTVEHSKTDAEYFSRTVLLYSQRFKSGISNTAASLCENNCGTK